MLQQLTKRLLESALGVSYSVQGAAGEAAS